MQDDSWTPECRGRRPQGVVAVAMRDLSALERILISTDGTVTDVLQSNFLEKMRLVVVSQFAAQARSPSVPLEIEAGEALLIRSIVLRGQISFTSYMHAESAVAVARLSPAVVGKLNEGEKPIGALIRESGLETRRELLWFGREAAGHRSEHLNVADDDLILARQYRIVSNALPVMLVTERFAPI